MIASRSQSVADEAASDLGAFALAGVLDVEAQPLVEDTGLPAGGPARGADDEGHVGEIPQPPHQSRLPEAGGLEPLDVHQVPASRDAAAVEPAPQPRRVREDGVVETEQALGK